MYNWSVEGDKKCYAWACSRTQWPVRKNVKILLGDSPDELPKILSEVDNIVSNNTATLKDLNLNPSDVEKEMEKWLWRYRSGGQFANMK